MPSPRWQPGQSGNPAGKPLGLQKASTIRKKILAAAPAFVDKLIESASQGDVQAARSLLACACPPLRPVELPVVLELPQGADLREMAKHVMAAMAAGLLSPGPASQMINSLAALARIVELDALENRIAALESRHER
jgi:hypothetical protein